MSRLPALLIALFLCCLSLLGLTHTVLRKLGWDELEHLHVVWLIQQGRTPFTDFFEHHLPSFWYLLAGLENFFGVTGAHSLLFGRALMGVTYLVSALLCYSATSRMRPEHRVLVTGLFLLLSACGSLFSLRPEALTIPLFFLAVLCLELPERNPERPLAPLVFLSVVSLGAAALTPRAWPIFFPFCAGAAWALRKSPKNLALWLGLSLSAALFVVWLLAAGSGGIHQLVVWVFGFTQGLKPPSRLFKLHRHPRFLFGVWGLALGSVLARIRLSRGRSGVRADEASPLLPAWILAAGAAIVICPIELWFGMYGSEAFFNDALVLAMLVGATAGVLLPQRPETSVLPAALTASVLFGLPALLLETRPFMQSLALLSVASVAFLLFAFDWQRYFLGARGLFGRFVTALPVLLVFQLAGEQLSLTSTEAMDSVESARQSYADWQSAVRTLSDAGDREVWNALEKSTELFPALQAREVACARFKGRKVLVESTGNPICLEDASYFWFGIVYFRWQTPVPGGTDVRAAIEADLKSPAALYFTSGFLDELNKFPEDGKQLSGGKRPPFEPALFGYEKGEFGWLRDQKFREPLKPAP